MSYTVFCKRTGKIVGRQSYPQRSRWYGCIEGDFDDVRFRIDPVTLEPYPFIDQDQLPWLIRHHCKKLRVEAGCSDSELTTAMINREIGAITPEEYAGLLDKRRKLDASAAALTSQTPIPQDYTNPEYWK